MSLNAVVNADCTYKFQELTDRKHRYIVFRAAKGKNEVVVEKTSASEDYGDFLADLPEDAPRFAVYEFEFPVAANKRSRLVFVSWFPDGAKVKEKMAYSSFRDALKRALHGLTGKAPTDEIEATNSDEISHKVVLAKLSR